MKSPWPVLNPRKKIFLPRKLGLSSSISQVRIVHLIAERHNVKGGRGEREREGGGKGGRETEREREREGDVCGGLMMERGGDQTTL